MPKEITHWLIASQATDELKGSLLGDLLSSYPFCLKLGAVFHDALFYNLNGSHTKQFLTLAGEFHGTRGEDTYRLVRDIYQAAQNSKTREPLLALMVGIISHIQADSSFHPLVYYVSGDYDHPDPVTRAKAVGSHRRFESLMDLYFCGGSSALNKYLLKTYLQRAEAPPPDLFEHALAQIVASKGWPNLGDVMARTFRFFSFVQRLSHNQTLSSVLYGLDRFSPDILRELIALFYGPQLNKKMPIMSNPITYKNPVTGQESTQTLQEIFQIAVEKIIKICNTIEPAIINNEPLPLHEPGPSLAFGITGVSKTDAKYFADEPVI
jgi:hypothetical protein